jgi:hypothetical protein
MTRNKKKKSEKNKLIVLPSDNAEMQKYLEANRDEINLHIISCIEYATSYNLPLIEIFNFKNSSFVITLFEKNFLENIDNIYQYYIKSENYEMCSKLIKLKSELGGKILL